MCYISYRGYLQEDQQNLSNSICGDKGDDLIRVLRQLTTVQRNIANLQVELQGRKVKIVTPYTFSFSLKMFFFPDGHTNIIYLSN